MTGAMALELLIGVKNGVQARLEMSYKESVELIQIKTCVSGDKIILHSSFYELSSLLLDTA